MTTDLESDLRREFDAARPPGRLTFSPESIVSQGRRSIRRRRLMASGSAAVAVALIAAGTTLMSRPHDSATPPPATRTATTGLVVFESGFGSGVYRVEFNRDAKVRDNVMLSVIVGKQRHDVGVLSTARAGQKPDAVWKSGMVQGHPFTIGLVPASDFTVKLVNDANYGISFEDLKGTGYSAFAVMYQNGDEKEASRPVQIASISWTGPNGIVDGVEGDHRLSGRILKIDNSVSEKVLLRPGKDGRTAVFGEARMKTTEGSYATPQTVATTDDSGVAVVTGRYPFLRPVITGGQQGWLVAGDGAPMAAGILPPGASDIGAILTTNEVARGLPHQERLPDGRVVFAIKAESSRPSQPSKDSIKAIIWTNADGTKGRKDVIQQKR
jgi:hypothetical protein